MREVRSIGIDWSGIAGPDQKKTIFVAEARDGELIREPVNGRTRKEVVDWLIEEAARDPNMIVGFDFGFSLPGWYLASLGITSARELWERMANERLTPRMEKLGLAGWMKEPEPPFWSASKAASGLQPGQEYRRTEVDLRAPGIQPKSVFQLVGSGQVGRGSLYGMQELHRLADAGFSVWPFDEARLPLVIEVYPRLFYGPLKRNDPEARDHFLEHYGFDDRTGIASASEDAFDALMVAYSIAHFEEEILALSSDANYALEGQIWWHEPRPDDAADPRERYMSNPRDDIRVYLTEVLTEFAGRGLTPEQQSDELAMKLDELGVFRRRPRRPPS